LLPKSNLCETLSFKSSFCNVFGRKRVKSLSFPADKTTKSNSFPETSRKSTSVPQNPKIPQTKSVDSYKNPPKTHHFPAIFRSHQRQEPAALAELLGAVGRTRKALAEKVPVLVKLMATADDQVGFWRTS